MVVTRIFGACSELGQKATRPSLGYDSPYLKAAVVCSDLLARLGNRALAVADSFGRRAEARTDPFDKLVTHGAVGGEALLAVAFDRGRVGGRPVLHVRGDAVGEFER